MNRKVADEMKEEKEKEGKEDTKTEEKKEKGGKKAKRDKVEWIGGEFELTWFKLIYIIFNK